MHADVRRPTARAGRAWRRPARAARRRSSSWTRFGGARRTCRLWSLRDFRAAARPAARTRAGSRLARASTQALVDCDVAVVAGGVTLYEACALGTPAVGLAVVPEQRRAIPAFARRGAVIDAGSRQTRRSNVRRAAWRGCSETNGAGGITASRARQLVDGRGARPRRRTHSGDARAEECDALRDRRAIVFDLDDTLYPYRAFVRSGFRAVARRLAAERRLRPAARAAGPAPALASGGRGRELQALCARFELPASLVGSLADLIREHTPSLAPAARIGAALTTLRPNWRIGVSDQRRAARPAAQGRGARPWRSRRRRGVCRRMRRRDRQAGAGGVSRGARPAERGAGARGVRRRRSRPDMAGPRRSA